MCQVWAQFFEVSTSLHVWAVRPSEHEQFELCTSMFHLVCVPLLPRVRAWEKLLTAPATGLWDQRGPGGLSGHRAAEEPDGQDWDQERAGHCPQWVHLRASTTGGPLQKHTSWCHMLPQPRPPPIFLRLLELYFIKNAWFMIECRGVLFYSLFKLGERILSKFDIIIEKFSFIVKIN